VIGKHQMAKHFEVTITDDSLAIQRRQDQIEEEAALDVVGIVTAYKNLKYVERDFRHVKADDLDLRPVFHRLENASRATC
jgi:hypothetical protein